ncbi:hypothetical protein HPB51_015980 [Rhipicephalus microplus]|uniref:Uncharacterized protein n=1 Tax=Rhipicephalus microplus TaxID=6941 RepID=A0A9J6DHZ1_RHIMP|nr:hypothetical protein HPB51_015980 [Rhipicephalus microplus]
MAYPKITQLKIADQFCDMAVHAPAPDNSVRGIIFNAHIFESDDQIFNELRARNPTIDIAKRNVAIGAPPPSQSHVPAAQRVGLLNGRDKRDEFKGGDTVVSSRWVGHTDPAPSPQSPRPSPLSPVAMLSSLTKSRPRRTSVCAAATSEKKYRASVHLSSFEEITRRGLALHAEYAPLGCRNWSRCPTTAVKTFAKQFFQGTQRRDEKSATRPR